LGNKATDHTFLAYVGPWHRGLPGAEAWLYSIPPPDSEEVADSKEGTGDDNVSGNIKGFYELLKRWGKIEVKEISKR